ncbi:MAG: hypothetical protein ACP5E3_18310 [Bacteroidales bacterium]
MKTLISFFNGQTENSTINEFENFALSTSAMNKVRGGEGTPDIWIPDEDDKKTK